MAYDIGSDILKQANECAKGFICLDEEGDCLCPVERLIGGEDNKVAFVQSVRGRYCRYVTSFGSNGHRVCMCPVRIEIYTRYGK